MNESKKNPNFFSNSDRQVFLIKLQNQLDMGALLSRYSRTSKLDIREVFYKEFESNEQRGRDFYERVFLEYGDESVAELVNIHLAVQDISNLLVKEIEETRIGASYIEKSSRYVKYDVKHDGKFLYLSFEKTGINGIFQNEYENLMDDMFSYYSRSLPLVIEIVRRENPFESISSDKSEHNLKAYETAVRSRALDDIRAILPVATITNVGISSNARTIVGIIQKLESSGLNEAKAIADMIYEEMQPEFGEIIKSAKNVHGKSHVEYLEGTRNLGKNLPFTHKFSEDVVLLNYNQYTAGSINEFFQGSKDNTDEENIKIIQSISEQRRNRRDKIPRQFEFIDLIYSLRMNYGAFREFQRHRMFSILRGNLDPEMGHEIPEYIMKSPDLSNEFSSLCKRSATLFKKIAESGQPNEAQYVLPFATLYNIKVSGNLRELVYFSELRSTPQAHPDLRKIAISMADEFIRREGRYSSLFKFIDRNNYHLGRFSQEATKEKKIENLKKK
ncbi:MAG: FAD-dependent thymidylate synthase [Candidatus Thermoplasmatota archaeon]|jgi:thymidylate synthase ThyX|nr:FAD-dependent thymidylate synthase [Candidatus Thermoplasmatota archaeon]